MFIIKSRRSLKYISTACLAAATISIQTILPAHADEAADKAPSPTLGTAEPDSVPTTQPGSTPKPLEGRVEEQQEESLPALEEKFKVGTTLDDAKLNALTPDNVWIQTPDWFGGKWHSETETISYMYDYKT